MRIYRCKFCSYRVIDNRILKSVKGSKYKMGLHYETVHKKLLPEDMDGFRFFYYLLTKKTHGACVECKQPTSFNKLSMKYSRFCSNSECKAKYKAERDRRMLARYGKVYLLDDAEQQKKMMSHRRIAGVYKFKDGTEFQYISSYEKDFLRYLDQELNWPSTDIFAPSPHTYTYEYKGKKHFYIPDFFIPSLNLEVEIKDDGSALNINPDSRAKDVIKDKLMRSLTNLVNYIKIINKNYDEFMTLIKGDNSDG